MSLKGKVVVGHDESYFDPPRSAPKSEICHRFLLSVAFLLTLCCLFLTYLGIDTYIESGRSFFGDTKTAVGYQWKEGSCDMLFDGYYPMPGTPEPRDRLAAICATARSRGVPPVGLKSVIGKARYSSEGGAAGGSDSDLSRSFLVSVHTGLMKQLPELEQQFEGHRRTISFMWLFFPGVGGAIACYFYARRSTPALFAVLRGRFEHIMYGKNRYSDAFDNFIKVNKKRQ